MEERGAGEDADHPLAERSTHDEHGIPGGGMGGSLRKLKTLHREFHEPGNEESEGIRGEEPERPQQVSSAIGTEVTV
jgi:hypothetical protein